MTEWSAIFAFGLYRCYGNLLCHTINSNLFNDNWAVCWYHDFGINRYRVVIMTHQTVSLGEYWKLFSATLRTFASIATAHLCCARYTWRGAFHVMYFKRAHRVETQQNIKLMTFAVTWSANIFVGCSVSSTFFRQITSFCDSFHYTKKQKKSVRGKF